MPYGSMSAARVTNGPFAGARPIETGSEPLAAGRLKGRCGGRTLKDEVTMHWRVPFLLLLLVSSGCSGPCPWLRVPRGCCYNQSLDDTLAAKMARDVARQHLLFRDGDEWPSKDFQAGYRQAYEDIALGSDGQTPLVPPPAYWKSCARTEAGHCRADDWFAGYTEGAGVAWSCRGEFNRVRSGRSCGTCP